MEKNNRSKKQVRYVEGIKIYSKAGTWYCDWNNYVAARQGKKVSVEGFVQWCEFRDLQPTG